MARAIDPTADSSSEARQLRERLERLEQESAQRAAEAHAALAAAQDRSYWLDRWRVDLNALMGKPGAGIVRAAFRALRALYRLAYDARNRTTEAVDGARTRVAGARRRLNREAADAPAPAAPAASGERVGERPVSDALGRNGTVDADDPRALAALVRADGVVGAATRAGFAPAAGQLWLGVGPTADEVLRVLGAAHPELACRTEDALGPGVQADAGFAVSGWTSAAGARIRLGSLRDAIKPGGALVLGVERGAQAPVTPAWVAANATPEWRVALYLPGGLEGDRDLYVLERA